MVGTSKILTVSYGTFSCTLEGFDDPFSTMRTIAEYFRDLAAEDRYFGAEPPQPDAEMLHRLAEREVQRRVIAKMGENSVALKALDEAGEEAPAPEPQSRLRERAAAKASAKARVMAEEQVVPPRPAPRAPVGPEIIDHGIEPAAAPQDESIAAKMQRIRAAVARARAAEVLPEDAPPQPQVGAPIADAFADVSEEDEAPAHVPFDAAGDETAGASAVAPEAEVEAEAEAGIDEAPVEEAAWHAPVGDEADSGEDDESTAEVAAADRWFDADAAVTEAPWEAPAETAEAEEVVAAAEMAAATDEAEPDEDAAVPAPAAEDRAGEEGEDALWTAAAEAGEPGTVEAVEVEAMAIASEETGEDTAIAADELGEHDDEAYARFDEDDLSGLEAMDDAAGISTAGEAGSAAADAPEEETGDEPETQAEVASVLTRLRAVVMRPSTRADEPAEEEAEIPAATEVAAPAADASAGIDEIVEIEYREIFAELAEVDATASGEVDREEVAAFAEAEAVLDDEDEAAVTEDDAPLAPIVLGAAEAVHDDFEDEIVEPPAETDDALAAAFDDAPAEAEGAEVEGAAEAVAGETAQADADNDDEPRAARDGDAGAVAPPGPTSSLSDEAEAELMEELAALENGEEAPRRDGKAIFEGPRGAEASVTRILKETESQLDDTEASRRRATIAHLKAAVAATRADGGEARESDDETNVYRDDLDRVVRPRRVTEPRNPKPAASPRRLAPLMLVSEQRIDLPAAGSRPDVSPRRITAGNLALDEHAEEHAESAAGDEDLFADSTSFADYAQRMGASDLPDLIEAAAAYSAFVEGRPHFSRPQLMKQVSTLGEGGYSREDGLRSFGTLLRQGKIQKLKRGQFTISKSSRFRPESFHV